MCIEPLPFGNESSCRTDVGPEAKKGTILFSIWDKNCTTGDKPDDPDEPDEPTSTPQDNWITLIVVLVILFLVICCKACGVKIFDCILSSKLMEMITFLYIQGKQKMSEQATALWNDFKNQLSISAIFTTLLIATLIRFQNSSIDNDINKLYENVSFDPTWELMLIL